MITVNIGLNKSTKYPGVKPGDKLGIAGALHAIATQFGRQAIKSTSATIRAGATESTLVVVLDIPGATVAQFDTEFRLHLLALELRQDCVAALDDTGEGILTGPYATGWGDFNIAYFLPEGNTSLDTVVSYLLDSVSVA